MVRTRATPRGTTYAVKASGFALGVTLLCTSVLHAQDSLARGGAELAPQPATHTDVPARGDPRLLSRRTLWTLGAFTVGAAAALPFDGRWTNALQSPRFQENRGLSRSASLLRSIGDPGALILSASVYAAGRLARRDGLADAGRHAGEAVLASGLVTLGLKTLVGRERPYAAGVGTDADEFLPGRGYRSDFASFPSGHTTVAFAAAAAFSGEISRTHPRAGRVASPLLYATATAVGASRLYNNKHWASDAIAGAAIGTLVGRGLVTLAHRAARR